jgi:hypothetical protein
MAITARVARTGTDALSMLPERYPNGNERVAANVMREVFSRVERDLTSAPNTTPHALRELHQLYARARPE